MLSQARQGRAGVRDLAIAPTRARDREIAWREARDLEIAPTRVWPFVNVPALDALNSGDGRRFRLSACRRLCARGGDRGSGAQCRTDRGGIRTCMCRARRVDPAAGARAHRLFRRRSVCLVRAHRREPSCAGAPRTRDTAAPRRDRRRRAVDARRWTVDELCVRDRARQRVRRRAEVHVAEPGGVLRKALVRQRRRCRAHGGRCEARTLRRGRETIVPHRCSTCRHRSVRRPVVTASNRHCRRAGRRRADSQSVGEQRARREGRLPPRSGTPRERATHMRLPVCVVWADGVDERHRLRRASDRGRKRHRDRRKRTIRADGHAAHDGDRSRQVAPRSHCESDVRRGDAPDGLSNDRRARRPATDRCFDATLRASSVRAGRRTRARRACTRNPLHSSDRARPSPTKRQRRAAGARRVGRPRLHARADRLSRCARSAAARPQHVARADDARAGERPSTR